MGTVERAKLIREALKAKGIKARQVSVTCDLYSMGSTIRVRIKDAAVKKAIVEEIANVHERIDRDHMSGEILSGANRFVDVEYTDEAMAAKVAELQPLIDALPDDQTAQDIGHGLRASFQSEGAGGYVWIWEAREGSHVINPIVRCWGRDFAARQLAEWLANRPEAAQEAKPEPLPEVKPLPRLDAAPLPGSWVVAMVEGNA